MTQNLEVKRVRFPQVPPFNNTTTGTIMSVKLLAAYNAIKAGIAEDKNPTLFLLEAFTAVSEAVETDEDIKGKHYNEKHIVSSAYSCLLAGLDIEGCNPNSVGGVSYMSFYNAMTLADKMSDVDYFIESTLDCGDAGSCCSQHHAKEVSELLVKMAANYN